MSGKEWGDAGVVMWGSGLDSSDTADLLLDGPEAAVIVEASFHNDLRADHVLGGLGRALELAAHRRQAGYVLVCPDRPAGAITEAWLAAAFPEQSGLNFDALARAVGWISWRDLGRLALDLAEEADDIRDDLVHRLVTELQALFPGIEI